MRPGALAAAAVLASIAPAAGAANLTPAQVATLAVRARTDPAALARLRAVDRVAGRRVDLLAALDSSGSALDARLRMLAETVRGAALRPPGGQPGTVARQILAERRFKGSGVPRPLHRPLSWLGRVLHAAGRALRHAYDSIGVDLPGGAAVFWTIAAALVAGAAGVATLRLGRRRAGRYVESQRHSLRTPDDDPRRLERAADEAEASGDYELALRLRFQAGLLHLARSDSIPAQGSLTNGEITRTLGSRSFASVATDFDEVVYGRRRASHEDASRARSGWERVLEETRRG